MNAESGADDQREKRIICNKRRYRASLFALVARGEPYLPGVWAVTRAPLFWAGPGALRDEGLPIKSPIQTESRAAQWRTVSALETWHPWQRHGKTPSHSCWKLPETGGRWDTAAIGPFGSPQARKKRVPGRAGGDNKSVFECLIIRGKAAEMDWHFKHRIGCTQEQVCLKSTHRLRC